MIFLRHKTAVLSQSKTASIHLIRSCFFYIVNGLLLSQKAFSYPRIIPAIVADIKETKVPPKTAFRPNSDKFLC